MKRSDLFVNWELDSDKFSSKYLSHGYGIDISVMCIWTSNCCDFIFQINDET